MRYKRVVVFGLLAALLYLLPVSAHAAASFCVPVTVGTSSTSLRAADTFQRSWIRICNAGGSTAYVCEGQGAANCTSALGTLLAASACLPDYIVHVNTSGASVPPPSDDFEAIVLSGQAIMNICVQ